MDLTADSPSRVLRRTTLTTPKALAHVENIDFEKNMDLGTPRNPWGAEKYPGVDVGSMEKILGLARRAGHLPPASQPRLDDEEISKAKSSSERLISQLKTITGLRKEINRLQLEIQASTQETSTSDVTHARALQQRAAQVEDLAKHFSSILQQKDELLNRLTEPFAGEHIQSAASHHKFITAVCR